MYDQYELLAGSLQGMKIVTKKNVVTKVQKKSTMKGHIDKKHSNQGNHKCEPCEFVTKNNQTLKGQSGQIYTVHHKQVIF